MTERTLQVRQIDALADWLSKSTWTIYEAACLLSGVLPPVELGGKSRFGGWLPGRKPWAEGRKAWEHILLADIARVEAILKDENRIPDRSPAGFLIVAGRLRIVPPWAETLLNGDVQFPSQSGRLRAALREALGRKKEANPRANASFAARADDWDKAVFRAEQLFREGLSPKEVADALAEEGFWRDRAGTTPYGTAAIRGWRRKLCGNREKGIPPKSAEELTASFRQWRSHNKR